jgi:hypothetical protein
MKESPKTAWKAGMAAIRWNAIKPGPTGNEVDEEARDRARGMNDCRYSQISHCQCHFLPIQSTGS